MCSTNCRILPAPGDLCGFRGGNSTRLGAREGRFACPLPHMGQGGSSGARVGSTRGREMCQGQDKGREGGGGWRVFHLPGFSDLWQMSLRFQTASRSVRFHLASSLGNFPRRGKKNKMLCSRLQASHRQGHMPGTFSASLRGFIPDRCCPAPHISSNPSENQGAVAHPSPPTPFTGRAVG